MRGKIGETLQEGANVHADSNGNMVFEMFGTPSKWSKKIFHDAVYKGELNLLKSQITLGADINSMNIDGDTILMVAASQGHVHIVKYLLSDERENLDINATNPRISGSYNALMFAVLLNKSEIVEILLAEDDIDVNAVDRFGQTALSIAVSQSYTEIVKLFLAHSKVKLNIQNNVSGETILMDAARNGREYIVKMLLSDSRIDVNVKDRDGLTALMKALESGRGSIVKLIKGHADIKGSVSPGGISSDIKIAAQKRIEREREEQLAIDEINLVKERSRNYQDYSKKMRTKFVESVIQHKIVKVETYLRHVIDLPDRYHDREMALLIASQKGYDDIVKLFLEYPQINLNIKMNGKTPLILAIEAQHMEVVKVLLSDRRVDVNLKSEEMFSPLIYAILYVNEDIVRLLLKHPNINVNINITNKTEKLNSPKSSIIRQEYIVALTANSDSKTKARCLELGMDAVLHKPVKMNELLNVISSFTSTP